MRILLTATAAEPQSVAIHSRPVLDVKTRASSSSVGLRTED
jgi:hypothetical protein